MSHYSRLRTALKETQKAFPFENYIDKANSLEMQAIIYELRKYLVDFEHKRLLDIGSGPMDKTGVFQSLGFECYAVDDLNDPWHLRNDNIDRIKEYAENIGINFYHQKPGEYNIPFEENSFDVVCSLAVIEHLHESPRGLLNTMGVFARPGGLLVIIMPNSVNLRKRISVLLGRTNYPPVDMFFNCIGNWRGHVREYTLKETEYICSASGFEILSSTTFEHLAHQKLRTPLRQLYILLGNIIPTLRSSLLVVCRKPESWRAVNEDPEAFRRSLARAVPKGAA
ncbi:Methyltransferase type 11 [Chloroherpeton thalassium ATCC 35110]|uniref:Methyltransferase type 11 n=1 Tax=Chloroherpeton thalassium (strain ATCC 35110 / GB-78) TaxID=517418 RepID=B3QRU6_CHLT3|nr:methyltransferase domain-containing protein [Chloroherpeton thalassium]ACF13899.1 Methyltransferase type 11 [Chloroherpeton thalassium ATCC 35110]